jgi:hypothetical protein
LAYRAIELIEEERVVERGTHRVSWFVRVRDAWIAASKVDSASTELEKRPGPGVVWRRHTRLELPPGTRVLRVEQSPRALVRTPLEHLAKSRSSPRQSSRRVYSIGSRGELVPETAKAR